MNNFLFGVLIGFLTFTNEGRQISQKAYDYGTKYGKDILTQMNGNGINNAKAEKGESEKCENTMDIGKQ